MKAAIANDIVREIYRLHEQGIGRSEIARALQISESTVHRYITRKRYGGNPATVATYKRCANCGGKLPEIRHAAFCVYCGADIRTPAAKAAEGLFKMLDDITKFYPAEKRDFAVQALNSAINLLKEGK